MPITVQDIFTNMIAQLLYTFSKKHTTESGQLFWSGLERLPKIIHFGPNDETRIEFVFSTTDFFAHISNLPALTGKATVAKLTSTVKVEQYQPKKAIIKENDKDTNEEKVEDDKVRIAQLTELLSSSSSL